MSGDLVYWLAWIGALAVYAAMVWIGWRALFGDRERGTRRCPGCWHNLSETRGLRCSECGKEVRRERDLFRTRRRYLPLLLAIVVSLGMSVWIQSRILDLGWMSLAPTKALIMTWPFVQSAEHPFMAEVEARGRSGDLSAREWAMLLKRCVRGDRSAPPVGPSWQVKYGAILEGLRGNIPPDQQERLWTIPPYVTLRTREQWPDGIAPSLLVDARDWWPRSSEVLVRAETDLEGVPPLSFRRTADYQAPPFSLPLVAMEPGHHEVMVSLTVERRESERDEWTPVSDTNENIRISVGGGIASLLTEVASDDLDEMIESVFGDGWVKWEQGLTPVRVNVRRQRTFNAAFANVAVGARVELRCDGELARQLDLWWMGGPNVIDRPSGWKTEFENLELLRTAGQSYRKWEMHVIGDPELALRVGEGANWWTGHVVVPIETFQRAGEQAPDVPWEVMEGEGY